VGLLLGLHGGVRGALARRQQLAALLLGVLEGLLEALDLLRGGPERGPVAAELRRDAAELRVEVGELAPGGLQAVARVRRLGAGLLER
jgi:hypothetical protein